MEIVQYHMRPTLYHSAMLAGERAATYESPEYLEEAIYRHRKFLRINSTNDTSSRIFTHALASLMWARSSRFQVNITGEGLPEAPPPGSKATSFANFIASLRARSTIDKANWWPVSEEHILALQGVFRTTNIAEIEEIIGYCRLLLASNSS
jgi:hypothetical protein